MASGPLLHSVALIQGSLKFCATFHNLSTFPLFQVKRTFGHFEETRSLAKKERDGGVVIGCGLAYRIQY